MDDQPRQQQFHEEASRTPRGRGWQHVCSCGWTGFTTHVARIHVTAQGEHAFDLIDEVRDDG